LKSANKDDANLAREIHHHRQFLHPHIARLYEVIVTENLVWLVLEYCPGDELYNYLLRSGALPVDKVQKIFAQLLGAVSYVHSQSCVHRDLKLENILLDKNESVKLVDFGFTREYEWKTNNLQTFCGTVCYSAPEMLKGEKYAGEKVDVWSLGVILFALLTGELPFDDDDDMVTKNKILQTEPEYPVTMSPEAKNLISKLLSKRPLVRPGLTDVLNDPFLASFAPAQHAILKLAKPPPFTTALEKESLQRMRSAGVDIDKVIENVLAQRCDSLSGWWALLMEKEERKEKRRERKKKEKEADLRSQRRMSGGSALRLSMLEGVDEEPAAMSRRVDDSPNNHGRRERRSLPAPQLIIPELPRLPEGFVVESPKSATPPPPIEKDPVRSSSSSLPPLPPKERERHRSRSSTLQLTANNRSLQVPQMGISKQRSRRRQMGIMSQLNSIKHWFMDSTRRALSPNSKLGASSSKQSTSSQPSGMSSWQSGLATTKPQPNPYSPSSTPPKPAPSQAGLNGSETRIPYRNNRSSLSPAPITPRSNYRRSSAGLRGRKSTSSSVSSVRSTHPVHTHSKNSSTSSRSESANSPALTSRTARSPHASVKVLPATSNNPTLPSNIRLVRTSPSPIAIPPSFAAGGPNPFFEPSQFRALGSPGLVFARRKKTPFSGPKFMSGSGSGPGTTAGGRSVSREGRRSGSVPRRHSRLIIEEEDEEEVEEVDTFSPVGSPTTERGDCGGVKWDAVEPGDSELGEGREDGETGWVDFHGGTDVEEGLAGEHSAERTGEPITNGRPRGSS